MIIQTLKCSKCEYEWFPRSLNVPKVCPKCKRYNWEGEEIEKFK